MALGVVLSQVEAEGCAGHKGEAYLDCTDCYWCLFIMLYFTSPKGICNPTSRTKGQLLPRAINVASNSTKS
ncbi:hypothetical protein WN943_013757 [Citrus x changshan-huyou]